jgi:hypothetical protein
MSDSVLHPDHQAAQVNHPGTSSTIDPNKPFPILPSTAVVKGISDSINGVYGGSKTQVGVIGESDTSIGVQGHGAVIGVFGFTGDSGDGVVGNGKRGVVGESRLFQGVYGRSAMNAGVLGESDGLHGTMGVSHANGGGGVFGSNDKGGAGVIGVSPSGIGVIGQGGSLAARFEGNVEVTGEIRFANADCAEEFDVACGDAAGPGSVMVLGEAGELHQSHHAYDKRVAGVISGAGSYKPGLVLDRQSPERQRQPLALLGKVYCKVDAQYGAVDVGDLLTTSDTPGHAMKAADSLRAFGTVIGKALRPLKAGQGLIPILISLQ